MSKKIKSPPGLLETSFYRVLPQALMELISKYFRLEVSGAENLPTRGPFIATPNHSGYSGLDGMLLAHHVRKVSGRQPRVLTHRLWFKSNLTKVPANKLGFIEASMANGLAILKKHQPLIVFPEGEDGNFKPTSQAYDLQEFKRGFVRMALKTGAPVIPTLVIGSEDSHINLSKLRLNKTLRGLVLPLPLNLVPLPARWKIVFMPAVRFPYPPESENDKELLHELAEEMREKMQAALNHELSQRKSVYF